MNARARSSRLRASRAFSNAAVGFAGDDFINLVVVFPAEISTEALLERLKAVERACGREPGAPKWEARTLDLDLLLHGYRVGRVAGKNLPHPDLSTRAWVLGPLAELAPDLIHPVAKERIDELWRQFDSQTHPLVPVALERELMRRPVAPVAAGKAAAVDGEHLAGDEGASVAKKSAAFATSSGSRASAPCARRCGGGSGSTPPRPERIPARSHSRGPRVRSRASERVSMMRLLSPRSRRRAG